MSCSIKLTLEKWNHLKKKNWDPGVCPSGIYFARPHARARVSKFPKCPFELIRKQIFSHCYPRFVLVVLYGSRNFLEKIDSRIIQGFQFRKWIAQFRDVFVLTESSLHTDVAIGQRRPASERGNSCQYRDALSLGIPAHLLRLKHYRTKLWHVES